MISIYKVLSVENSYYDSDTPIGTFMIEDTRTGNIYTLSEWINDSDEVERTDSNIRCNEQQTLDEMGISAIEAFNMLDNFLLSNKKL